MPIQYYLLDVKQQTYPTQGCTGTEQQSRQLREIENYYHLSLRMGAMLAFVGSGTGVDVPC